MEYTTSILDNAPRSVRLSLELSERMDGHRRHSMVSLALELDVYPHRVLDAARAFMVALAVEDGETVTDVDYLETAYTGPRYGGGFELPAGHPASREAFIGDAYLTDDAIVWVLEHVRPPSFLTASPVVAPRSVSLVPR